MKRPRPLSPILSVAVLTSCLTFGQLQSAIGQTRCERIFGVSNDTPSIYDQIRAIPPYDTRSIESYVNKAKNVDTVAAAIVDRQTQKLAGIKAEIEKADELWKGDKDWISYSQSHMKFDPRNADIIIFFPLEQSLKILEQGFLNQHQTGTSMGNYDPKARAEIENELVQLKLGTSVASAKLRPKYGIVNFREDLPILGAPSYASSDYKSQRPPRNDYYNVFEELSEVYGKVAAVMKSHVQRRATFTSRDTRGNGGGTHESQIFTFQSGTMSRFAPDTYYEAQIYGNLRASDVDYFLVQDVNFLEALKVFGRPIYQVKKVFFGYRVVFEKGQRLF